MLTTLLELASRVPPPVLPLIVAVVLAVESGTVLGMAIPGSTVAAGLGIWAGLTGASIPVAVVAAALGTVLGAHVGWWRGRHGVVVPSRLAGVRGVPPTLRRARRWLAGRHGLTAASLVAAGHWASVLRPVMPRVAGASGLGYRWAGPSLVVSGTLWAATLVGLGARIGPAVAEHVGWIAPTVVAVAVLCIVCRTRLGADGDGDGDGDGEDRRAAAGQPTRSSNSPALAPCTNAEISSGV